MACKPVPLPTDASARSPDLAVLLGAHYPELMPAWVAAQQSKNDALTQSDGSSSSSSSSSAANIAAVHQLTNSYDALLLRLVQETSQKQKVSLPYYRDDVRYGKAGETSLSVSNVYRNLCLLLHTYRSLRPLMFDVNMRAVEVFCRAVEADAIAAIAAAAVTRSVGSGAAAAGAPVSPRVVVVPVDFVDKFPLDMNATNDICHPLTFSDAAASDSRDALLSEMCILTLALQTEHKALKLGFNLEMVLRSVALSLERTGTGGSCNVDSMQLPSNAMIASMSAAAAEQEQLADAEWERGSELRVTSERRGDPPDAQAALDKASKEGEVLGLARRQARESADAASQHTSAPVSKKSSVAAGEKEALH